MSIIHISKTPFTRISPDGQPKVYGPPFNALQYPHAQNSPRSPARRARPGGEPRPGATPGDGGAGARRWAGGAQALAQRGAERPAQPGAAPAFRLARRREAGSRPTGLRRQPAGAGLRRRGRLHRRLHGLPAAARRRACLRHRCRAGHPALEAAPGWARGGDGEDQRPLPGTPAGAGEPGHHRRFLHFVENLAAGGARLVSPRRTRSRPARPDQAAVRSRAQTGGTRRRRDPRSRDPPPGAIGCIDLRSQDGYTARGLLRSPLLGPKGNAEFLAWLSLGFPPDTAGLAPPVQGSPTERNFQLQISKRWSKASFHPLPSPEPPHSPITCTTSCRWRGRTSKSTKTTCCQVPSVSLPSTNGTVSEGPSSAARTWECPLPSPHLALWA